MSGSITVFDPNAVDGIDQLLTNNQKWAANEKSKISDTIFSTLAVKQKPQILWLGCSDSRVPEDALLGLNPGEVFTHRNIANLFNPQDVSFPAVLEYAVDEVLITHVILCGHTKCGGVTAATKPDLTNLAPVDNWLMPLKMLMKTHSKLMSTSSDPVGTLVALSVQHGVKLLKATNTIASHPAIVVHGAIYDITTGLLGFLGEDKQPSLTEPLPDFMSTPAETIQVGSFDTSEVRSQPQAITSKAYTFAQPHSKPPRIVLGLTSFDVSAHHDNPRMACTASNITNTGFTVNINTWGSSQINSASCTWLEIPDTADYAEFQTGHFGTSDDHVWSSVQALTTRQINFTTPFSAPPTVVVWLTGFDTAQNPSMSISVYATDVTATGFVMNLDTLHSVAVYSQWTNWVAIPAASPFGLQTADFGIVGALTQSTTGTSVFDQRDLNATLAPAVVGALNQIFVASPTTYKVKMGLSNVTGSTVAWSTSTWGDATMTTCKGTYITVPMMPAMPPPGADM